MFKTSFTNFVFPARFFLSLFRRKRNVNLFLLYKFLTYIYILFKRFSRPFVTTTHTFTAHRIVASIFFHKLDPQLVIVPIISLNHPGHRAQAVRSPIGDPEVLASVKFTTSELQHRLRVLADLLRGEFCVRGPGHKQLRRRARTRIIVSGLF